MENASSPTITKARGSLLLGGGLELGILSVLASNDFPKIDLVKKSSITGFSVSTNVDYGKLITGIDQSQENYRKCLFVVKEKGATVKRCLYCSVCAISSYTSGACISVCLPSIAPMQLGNCHSE